MHKIQTLTNSTAIKFYGQTVKRYLHQEKITLFLTRPVSCLTSVLDPKLN